MLDRGGVRKSHEQQRGIGQVIERMARTELERHAQRQFWVRLNIKDGGAAMMFQMRDDQASDLWAAATW